jgi:hypothetical protein
LQQVCGGHTELPSSECNIITEFHVVMPFRYQHKTIALALQLLVILNERELGTARPVSSGHLRAWAG